MGLRAGLRHWFEEMNSNWNKGTSYGREEAMWMFSLTAIAAVVGFIFSAVIVIVAIHAPAVVLVAAALLAVLILAFRWITKPGRFDK